MHGHLCDNNLCNKRSLLVGAVSHLQLWVSLAGRHLPQPVSLQQLLLGALLQLGVLSCRRLGCCCLALLRVLFHHFHTAAVLVARQQWQHIPQSRFAHAVRFCIY